MLCLSSSSKSYSCFSFLFHLLSCIYPILLDLPEKKSICHISLLNNCAHNVLLLASKAQDAFSTGERKIWSFFISFQPFPLKLPISSSSRSIWVQKEHEENNILINKFLSCYKTINWERNKNKQQLLLVWINFDSVWSCGLLLKLYKITLKVLFLEQNPFWIFFHNIFRLVLFIWSLVRLSSNLEAQPENDVHIHISKY